MLHAIIEWLGEYIHIVLKYETQPTVESTEWDVKRTLKVVGALVWPNCMRRNLWMPEYQVNEALPQFSLAIGTCQYPDLASSMENYDYSQTKSTQSSIQFWGMYLELWLR